LNFVRYKVRKFFTKVQVKSFYFLTYGPTLLAILVINIFVFTSVRLCSWQLALIIPFIWIAAYIGPFQLLMRLRLCYEHLHLDSDKSSKARTLVLGNLTSMLLAPHNLAFHNEHHLYPYVPFYYLKDLHNNLIRENSSYLNNLNTTTSYFESLSFLFREKGCSSEQKA